MGLFTTGCSIEMVHLYRAAKLCGSFFYKQPAPLGFMEYIPVVVRSSRVAGDSKDDHVSAYTLCYGFDNIDSETTLYLRDVWIRVINPVSLLLRDGNGWIGTSIFQFLMSF